LAASKALDVHAVIDVKQGTPPDVPATVSASVPLVVIGEPPTEIIPPVKVSATLVTVPVPTEIVLQPNPVALVQINAFVAPEQDGNVSPEGVVAVTAPST
jgi:hypothetical protein